MFNSKTIVGAEYETISAPSLKKTQIALLLTFSMILNVIAASYSNNSNLLISVNKLNVQRPEILVGIAFILLSIIAILFYVIFTLAVFKVSFYFIFNENTVRKYLSNFLLLFTLYAYSLVAIWNIINQFLPININPIVMNLPLSNLISYVFIGLLYYIFLVPKSKVFIAPLALIIILILINMTGEFFK